MKRLVLILVALAFITSVMISCSKTICPAYSFNDTTVEVENNV
ncbi:MAG: hypothetical protein R6W78_08350 [Bacteroidales bacterium]